MSDIRIDGKEAFEAAGQVINSVSLLAQQCLVMQSGLITVSQNWWSGNRCNRFIKIWNDVLVDMKEQLGYLETELPNMIKRVISSISEFDLSGLDLPNLQITEFFQGLNQVEGTNGNVLKITNIDELKNVYENLNGMLEFIEGNFKHLETSMTRLNAAVDLGQQDEEIMATFEYKFSRAKDVIYKTREAMCQELLAAMNQAETYESGIKATLASVFAGETSNA